MSQGQSYLGDHLSRANRLYCARLQLTSADLTEEATTQAFDLGTALPSTAVVDCVRMRLNDAFDTGGAVNAITIEVGDDTTDDNSLIESTDVFTGAALEGADWSAGDTRGAVPTGVATGSQLSVLFTSVNGNLDEVLNGDLEVEVYYRDLADTQRL
jgi:hypothetical protein